MHERLTVACAQVEPVIFDRDATIEKLGRTAAEAASKGARLVVFPEAVIPAYPSSVWAKALAGWEEEGAKEAFALLAREAVLRYRRHFINRTFPFVWTGFVLLGAAASLVCYGFVGSLKNRLKLDDSLDVFGIHGLGGVAGSIGTAIVALPVLGGHGGVDYAFGHQLVRQLAAVAVAIAWSAAGSALCFGIVKLVIPLRHPRDAEREGLDIADHGERAYNY